MVIEIVTDDKGKVVSATQNKIVDGYIKKKPLDEAAMAELGIDLLNKLWMSESNK